MKRGLRHLIIRLIFFGTILSSGQVYAAATQDVWVEAYVNTTVVYVGQTFRYVVTAGIKNGTVHLPGARVLWPSCRMLNYQEADVSDRHEGYRAQQGQYTLMALGIKKINFPALGIGFTWPEGTTASAQSSALTLNIASRNPQGTSLRNPRGPRAAQPIWYFFLIPVILFILGVVWLDFVSFKHRTLRKRPAHLTAYHKLEALGRSRMALEGRVDHYFMEVSRVLRNYVGERYQISALELPRVEIMAVLKRNQVPPHIRRLLNSILIQADLVKFAKSWAEFSRIAVAQRRARKFIDGTCPVDKKRKTKLLAK
jgi:hypothetical protein